MTLSVNELKALDSDIDRDIESFSLLSHPREVATRTILMIYEWTNQVQYTEVRSGRLSRQDAFVRTCQQLDIFDHALKWSIRFSPVDTGADYIWKPEQTFPLGIQMLSQASEYEPVYDHMNAMFRGWAKGDRPSKDTVRIFYDQSREYAEKELADLFLRDRNNPYINIDRSSFTSAETVIPDYDIDAIPTIFEAQFSERSKEVCYTLKKSRLQPLIAQYQKQYRRIWDFEDGIELGGYYSDELLQFWCTMAAISLVRVHSYYPLMEGENRNTIGLKLLDTRSKSDWAHMVAELSDLSFEVVERIVDQFTLNSCNYGKKDLLPEFVYMPFLKDKHDNLSLAASLLLNSNISRSAANVINIANRQAYSEIQNRRSERLRETVVRCLQKEGIRCIDRPFKYPGGDIDLVAVDERDRCVICFELKAFRDIHSDREKAVVIDDLKHAVKQAKRSVKWTRDNKARFAELIEVSAKDLSSYDVFGMVVTSSRLLLNHVFDKNTPTLNSMLVANLVPKIKDRKLRRLHKAASELSYLPKEGTHFVSIPGIIPSNFGNITFHSDRKRINVLRNWDQRTDLQFLD